MNDLISRQDAVNEIHKYFVEEIDKTPTEIDEDGDELYADMPTVNSLLACNKELSKRIKSLPSTESTGAMDEAIQKYIKDGYMQPIGEDLISRQDAIDAFGLSEKTRKYGGDHSGYNTMMLYEIQDVLESIPSAPDSRQRGEWIFEPKDAIELMFTLPKCSECGFESSDGGNFCSNCGARMKGGEDE